MSKSISSCKECKDKCCETGPGPYKALKPLKYLDNYGTCESYNTKCEGLTRSGKCKYWGTNTLPSECRSYVCQTRSYTKKELKAIEMVCDDYACENCEAQYLLVYKKDGAWVHDCEICGLSVVYTAIYFKGRKSKEEVSPRC